MKVLTRACQRIRPEAARSRGAASLVTWVTNRAYQTSAVANIMAQIAPSADWLGATHSAGKNRFPNRTFIPASTASPRDHETIRAPSGQCRISRRIRCIAEISMIVAGIIQQTVPASTQPKVR